ncbi:cytochrome ubiquinol oxidase subunit I [Jatrophihabitans cynanchi]|uniref:Cytochrome ubiquinol oxidase subunit I n=1 Tax=Jatrophihabitans cynanchi TaxID=2944128 RepID=A0ABY7K301_9ACTN|nr:cytochrome ubiquinol oxidase subunit I [Jatrophihabitans sp. SB3-54]WAX58273.1 cytochrome ubiquinol oxidase subunit I [Jatrophihabitans sp. SB3-54]
MNTLDISRWQFGIITIYHFLFVPITIGLSAIVACYQTAWLRTGTESYLRLTKFFGKLFLINFAIGVATGIVQEFQFGMNWSEYSRFVGDVFGAPLAMEGLLAFFLESTFLGLWIFGWDRLPRRIHLACIWIVHVGTLLSAYFILAANSWMQHPVGYALNPKTHRAELKDIGAVLFNSTQLVTFPHTISACFLTGGAFVLGIGLWQLMRAKTPDVDRVMYRNAARVGAWVSLVSGALVAITGDLQGKIMTEQQPMKMAAAEALYNTRSGASFSLFTIGSLDGKHEIWSLRLPKLLSFLATGSFNGKVDGINQIQAAYVERYGPGSYLPVVPATYWSFRLMIGLGVLAMLVAAATLWATRRGRQPRSRLLFASALVIPVLPVAANSFGWLFTEMGRQPWAVFGVLSTRDGVSPGVSPGAALTSLLALTVLYAVLAVVEFGLLAKYIRAGADPYAEPADLSLRDLAASGSAGEDADRPLTFAY